MTTHFGTFVQITITAAILTVAANSEKAEAGETNGIQVDVQSRFLRVEDNFLRDVGVDFRGLGHPYGTPNFELDALNAAERGSYEAEQNIRRARNFDLQNQHNNSNYSQTNGNYGYNGITSPALEGLLRALDKNEKTEILSNPKVTTQNSGTATVQHPVNNNSYQYQNRVPLLVDLPVIGTQFVNTNVKVSDGETVVLGGIHENNNHGNQTHGNAPYLSKIPFAGESFRNRGSQRDQNELLILVTPHILRNTPEE